MPNLNDTRRDGSLQRLSLDNGIARANRDPLDPQASKWVDRDAWRSINAQVRQWKADVDAYAWALPISKQDEPEPKYFDTEDGDQRLNPAWAERDKARQIVDNATADTVALYEARQGVAETRTGPDGEPEEYTPDRQMIIEWPDSEPGDGQVYAVTASVTDQREAKIVLSVASGDSTRLQEAADALARDKLATIRSNGFDQFGDVLDAYRAHERASWDRQLEQARAFKADSTATTPLMDDLADKRGLSRSEMADRIIARADEFQAQAGDVIGRQQALEDQARAAKDAGLPNQVEAVPDL